MVAPKRGTVTIQHNGKDYLGNYRFAKGLLTVHYADEYKNVFLRPASDPELMARIILADIIKKMPKE